MSEPTNLPNPNLQKLLEEVANLPRLHVPVPPNLERALGYPYSARFVAFWMDAEDDLKFHDGQVYIVNTTIIASHYTPEGEAGEGEEDETGAGLLPEATFVAWITYSQHPKVSPGLFGYRLGGNGEDAVHVLLLDRETRLAYVALKREVRPLLKLQHPNQQPPHPEPRAPMPASRTLPDGRTVSAEQVQELLEATFADAMNPHTQEARQRLQAEHAEHDAMLAWLDAYDLNAYFSTEPPEK